MKRDSRFEIWRVLSMLFILLEHYSYYGNWKVKNLSSQFFLPYGEIGVDIFIMISGYFLCQQQVGFSKTTMRVLKIWMRTIFYSWSILLIFFLFRFPLGMRKIISTIFPVLSNNYWFVTSFLVLMIIVPILNLIVNTLTKKQIRILILAFVILTCITPFVGLIGPFGGFMTVGILITCYLTASYIRIYGVTIPNVLIIIILFLALGMQYLSLYLGHSLPAIYGILPYIASTCVFILVTRSKPFYSKTINWCASSVFASYLITQNIAVYDLLWRTWLNVSKFENRCVAMGILICLALFVITIFIDKLYLFLEKRCFSKLIVKIERLIHKAIF